VRHIGEQRAEFGQNSNVYVWHYPPSVVAILRDSGLPRALIVVTALAFPAVLINLGHGQNGFLTGSARRRIPAVGAPPIAGTSLALLADKPQFGLVIPATLIAGRHFARGCVRRRDAGAHDRGDGRSLRSRKLGRLREEPCLHARIRDRTRRGRLE
jgi:hypothetical protein